MSSQMTSLAWKNMYFDIMFEYLYKGCATIQTEFDTYTTLETSDYPGELTCIKHSNMKANVFSDMEEVINYIANEIVSYKKQN